MKIRLLLPLLPLAMVWTLSSCDKPSPGGSEAPSAEATGASKEPEKTFAEVEPASEPEPEEPSGPVDIGFFGSDEPHEREDMPRRGIITFTGDDGKHTTQQHWEQWDWEGFDAKRWGRYHVRITYTMRMSTLPMQFKVAEQRLKKTLKASYEPQKSYLGTVYIPAAGPQPFAMYSAAKGVSSGLEIQEVAFIPAPEGDPVAQDGKSAITLPAASATTWSEMMRYEPKPEKQCLGFWTSEEDFAEWEFEVAHPGKYEVVVTHGCGNGNDGSEVAVLSGEDRLTFKVADTGGFQNWKDVVVGEIAFAEAGTQRLVIDPLTRANKAVLDVRKVVLTPVN